MEVTVCDEQVAALAAMPKGDVTEAPLAGLPMVTPPAVVTGVEELGELATVMAMLATQEAPELPQDLTCSVCAPAEAVTVAATEVLFTIAVTELLSRE